MSVVEVHASTPDYVGSSPVRLFPKEVERGSCEYKLRLLSLDKVEHLRSQLRWRLEEGEGKATYRLGVSDNGVATGIQPADLDESIRTLMVMAEPFAVDVTVEERYPGANGRECATVVVQARLGRAPEEVRVAMVGEYESGKSTLLAVLIASRLDNGHGRARRSVHNHKHELTHGRTSSISMHSLDRDDAANGNSGSESVFINSEWRLAEPCAKPAVYLLGAFLCLLHRVFFF